jgi:hypothetical protein
MTLASYGLDLPAEHAQNPLKPAQTDGFRLWFIDYDREALAAVVGAHLGYLCRLRGETINREVYARLQAFSRAFTCLFPLYPAEDWADYRARRLGSPHISAQATLGQALSDWDDYLEAHYQTFRDRHEFERAALYWKVRTNLWALLRK